MKGILNVSIPEILSFSGASVWPMHDAFDVIYFSFEPYPQWWTGFFCNQGIAVCGGRAQPAHLVVDGNGNNLVLY